jgi:hypothetical protein
MKRRDMRIFRDVLWTDITLFDIAVGWFYGSSRGHMDH